MTPPPDLPAGETGARPATETGAQPAPETASFVEFAYATLEDKRAADLVWLDVRGITDLADDFLIATIHNARQGGAILDTCEKEAKRRGIRRLGIEGESGSSWVLLDYGDLVVHLFFAEQRAYYALEHIWADAKTVRKS